MLFNIYLEFCLKESPELGEAIKKQKLNAFTDDMLLICKDK